jgi:hypothetical protein
MSINIPNIAVMPASNNNVIIINNQPRTNSVWDFENDWHDGIFKKKCFFHIFIFIHLHIK